MGDFTESEYLENPSDCRIKEQILARFYESSRPFGWLERDHARLEGIVSDVITEEESDNSIFLTNERVKTKMLGKNVDKETAVVLNALLESRGQIKEFSNDQSGRETQIHLNDLRALKKSCHERINASDSINRQLSNYSPFHASIMRMYRGVYSPPTLYGDGQIAPFQVVQARAGNCHFTAGLASLAALNPEAISNMIDVNPDGTYTVIFPNAKPINVERPTVGKLLYHGQVPSYGSASTWPFVMQEAYGKYAGGKDVEDAPASINYHGLKVLSGGPVDIDPVWRTTYSTMNRKLKESVEQGLPVEVGIHGELLAPLGLADNRENFSGLDCGHAYAVIDFQPNDQTPALAELTIKDPNGFCRLDPCSEVKPPAGIVSLGDGRLKMNLETFSKIFSDIGYATKQPSGNRHQARSKNSSPIDRDMPDHSNQDRMPDRAKPKMDKI